MCHWRRWLTDPLLFVHGCEARSQASLITTDWATQQTRNPSLRVISPSSPSNRGAVNSRYICRTHLAAQTPASMPAAAAPRGSTGSPLRFNMCLSAFYGSGASAPTRTIGFPPSAQFAARKTVTTRQRDSATTPPT